MTALEDLRLLRTFVRIAESGSISAAARALNTPQPTLSRQLRHLENVAGVVLVRRDTHAMSLTAAGERLLTDARKLLSLAEVSSERLREERETARGHLRIVAVLDSGQWIVSRLLAGFRKIHPEVTAELHLTNRPSKFIAEGFDCGILVGPVTDMSVAARKAGEIRRVLVAAPELLQQYGTPAGPDDLDQLPWMGILQPHFFIRDRVPLRRKREQRVVQLAPVLVMDGVTALREAAIAGAGMTVLPEWLIGEALHSRKLVPVLRDWLVPPVDIHVVFPSGGLPGRVRAFVDYALAHLPSLIQELPTIPSKETAR
jgi:DNA-binding transcriptional LysR family regulator